VNSLPGKQELLSFESRWLRRAGALAILGSLIFAIGVIVQQAGIDATDNDHEQLQQFHENGGQLIAGQVLQGFGFSLFAFPIYVLFRAAAGRTDRMRRAFLPLAVIGPPLFFIGAVVAAVGLKDAADQYVEERPAIERQARQEAAAPPADQGTTTEAPTTEGTTTEGTSTEAPSDAETPDERVDDALEERAEDLAGDSSAVQIGSGMRLTATLALVFAMVYVPLWAMRTGLLTRFWATLGMALGASLILVGILGLMGLVLWFAAIGLQLAGWWPGPRPPAWETGEAIPWQRPGQDLGPPPDRPPAGGGDAVEGSGREVSEQPLPEGHTDESGGETQDQRRKKRKRRQ
jgi:hypothetical protein